MIDTGKGLIGGFRSVLLVGALLWTASAQAQVDQQNTTGSNAFNSTNLAYRFGQSFTPTLSGLNYITLNLNSSSATTNSALSLTVYQGAGFGGTALGTSNIVSIVGTTNQAYTFSFSNLVPLTPGGTYTFAAAEQASVNTNFLYSTANPYTRGGFYQQTGAGSGGLVTGVDLRFSEGIAAVPEPGTWALMILGFGAAGGALRLRKREVSPRPGDALLMAA